MKIRHTNIRVDDLSYLNCSIDDSTIKMKNLRGDLEIQEITDSTLEFGRFVKTSQITLGIIRNAVLKIKKPQMLDIINLLDSNDVDGLKIEVENSEYSDRFFEKYTELFSQGHISFIAL